MVHTTIDIFTKIFWRYLGRERGVVVYLRKSLGVRFTAGSASAVVLLNSTEAWGDDI